ncbi:DNA methyltransferase [Mesorhizobium sp. M0203]|uniref:DNA methyltransferase n=1 Tax=Mesorhizobium sp. M0203 TaxID=2956912 RepID=UPI003337CF9F
MNEFVRSLDAGSSIGSRPVASDIAGPNQPVRVRDSNEWNFDAELHALQEAYEESGSPVAVNFRNLVPLGSGVDRATHLFHSYPAKLLLNIPLFFINCTMYSSPNDVVFDPFSGSGTVLVEALLAGRRALGADANPLARLIATAKTTHIDADMISTALGAIVSNIDLHHQVPFTTTIKKDIWFSEDVVLSLGALLYSIRKNTAGSILAFMEACFSACIKRLSVSDPRLSVPVRLKGEALSKHVLNSPAAIDLFAQVVVTNCARLAKMPVGCASVIHTDARQEQPDGVVQADLIITSPPYAGAQKYIRASSLSIGWLGLAPSDRLRELEKLNIGREHFYKSDYSVDAPSPLPGAREILAKIKSVNPLRSHIANTYLREMDDAANAIVSRLRQHGHLILVVGDNMICGRTFPTSQFVKQIFTSKGLSTALELVDDIRSRGLMTKRNKTAGTIEREHVIVFQKR